MRDVHIPQPAPKIEKVEWLPQQRPQAPNPARPRQNPEQRRIDGDKAHLHVRIVPPRTQQEVGLDRLSTDVVQAGPYDGNLQPLLYASVVGCHVPGEFLTPFFSNRDW